MGQLKYNGQLVALACPVTCTWLWIKCKKIVLLKLNLTGMSYFFILDIVLFNTNTQYYQIIKHF